MKRVIVGIGIVASMAVGGWLAYASTPRPVRSLIPDMRSLSDWHASVIGALVVNREIQ